MTNTQDTSSAVVADAASGAGALAPAPEVLTIDKDGKHSLRLLWLPAEKSEGNSTAYMQKAMRKAYDKRGYEELLTAYCAVMVEWRKTVSCIRERGGLLHIGAPV